MFITINNSVFLVPALNYRLNKTIKNMLPGKTGQFVFLQKILSIIYTATSLSLKASLREVFLSVDSFLFPIIKAHGT